MSQSQPVPHTETPEVFTLQKMQAHEITDAHSRIYCDGHFFPLSIAGVPASDYDEPIYRLTAVEPQQNEEAAA